MKTIALIFSILMSFFFDEGRINDAQDDCLSTGAISECDSQNSATRAIDFNDTALLPVGTTYLYGGGSNYSAPVRSFNSGRRIQSSSKSGFRIIKEGKIFDRNNFITFRTDILQFQSGIHSNSRYIYSICHLLI